MNDFLPDDEPLHDDPEQTGEAMAVYRRGLPLAEGLKGAFGRFLPGALVGLTAVLSLLEGVPGAGEFGGALLVLLGGATMMTLGFAAGLEALRRWLYPDAQIAGRKSLLAGLMAPVAVFVAGALMSGGMSLPVVMSLLLLVPCGLALLMFFAWLTPTPEALRDQEYVEPDELKEIMLRSWPNGEDGASSDLVSSDHDGLGGR